MAEPKLPGTHMSDGPQDNAVFIKKNGWDAYCQKMRERKKDE